MDDAGVLGIINQVTGQGQANTAALPAVLSQAAQSGTTPDQEAEWQRLAKESNVPVGLIRNGAPVKLLQLQQQAGDLPTTSPVTAQTLMNPDNAAIAHDDIGTLTRLEDLAKNGFGPDRNAPVSTLQFASPNSQADAAYFGREYGTKPFQAIQGGTGKLATKLAFPMAAAVDAVNGDDYYKEFASQLYDTFSQIQKDSGADPSQTFGGKLIRSVQELVPMVLSGGAGLAEIVGQATNDKYDELTAKGDDPDTALAMAMKSGMTAYAMTKLPFGGTSLSNSLARGAMLNPAFGALDRGLEKAGLNYVGYRKQADDINLLDPETMAHDLAMGLLFGAQHAIQSGRPVMGDGLMESLVPFYDQYRAGRRADALTEIGKVVQDSKVNNRAPDLVQQHLSDVATEHAGIDNAYVPVDRWNELFQSAGLDPAEVADQVLSNPEAYHEANKTGSDIVIPFGEFTGKLSGLEQYGELVKDAKLALGDTSLREAEAHVQAVRDNAENGGGLIDTLKNMFARSQDAVKGNESYNKVYDDLVGQQLGIGTERGTAEKNAQLVANAFRVMGDRSGVNPYDLYSQYNLKLARPMDKTLTDRVSINTSIDPMLERLRAGDVPKEADVYGPSLLDTLRETGLKDSGGELAKMEVDADRQPFQRKIVRDDGMELDKARQMLVGKGYLPEGSTVNDLLDAIDTEMRGARVSSDQYRNAKLLDEHLSLTQLKDHLDRMGIDVHGMNNEEIRKALAVPMEGEGFNQKAISHLAADGVIKLYQSDTSRPVTTFDSKKIARNTLPESTEGLLPSKAEKGEYYHVTVDKLQDYLDKHGDGFLYRVANKRGIDQGYDIGLSGYKHQFKNSSAKVHSFTTSLEDAKQILANSDDPDNMVVYRIRPADLHNEFVVQIPSDRGATGAIHVQSPVPAPVRMARVIYTNGEWSKEAPDVSRRIIAERARETERQAGLGHDEVPGRNGSGDPGKTEYHQSAEITKRGYIRFDNNRNFEIGLLKDANLSTFIHESGHFFTEVMGDLAERPDSPQQIKDDYATLLKFAGVESRADIQTEHHEKLAEAFEAYIKEGNAPSVEMHPVFQRMKAWMLSVYKDMSALRVKLNPEIRDVFDRMLATDTEIERMRDMEDMKPLFTSAEDAGMSQAEFELYRKDAEQAGELAKEQLLRKLMAEKEREQKQWWKDERKKTWAEVEAEAKDDPIYQTYQALTAGKTFDGRDVGNIKLSREALVNMYGEAFVKSLPREFQRVYSKDGGIHPDAVAEMAGFGSGDEMVRKMAAAPKMKDYVKAETDQRMRERYGDMMTDGSIHEQALKDVHNDAQGKVMRAELLAIQRKAREVKPFVDAAKKQGNADAEATARWYTAEGRAQDAQYRAQRDAMLGAIPPIEFFKITASEAMGAKRVAEIQPHLYAYAARTAARESFEAAAKRNYREAGEAKYRELLNHYLYKEAAKARDFADKVQAYATKMGTLKELGKFGQAGGQFLDQIRAILDRYSFDRISNKEADERMQQRESLDSFLNRMKDEEGVDLPIPDDVRLEGRQTSYKNISMDELRGVYDSMRMLEHAARQVNQVNAEGRKVEITQAALSLSNKLFRSIKGAADMARKSDGAASLLDRVKDCNLDISVLLPEFMFERFDGLKKVGPWHEFIWDRYNDAADHQIRLREQLFPKIMEYAHGKAIDRSMGKIHIDSINADLVKDDIVAIALNCGNASNLDKLMRGGLRFKGDEAPHILNHEALQEILSHLSAKEIGVVNGIWKTIESLKPEAAELARKRTGVEPNWIESLPMQIKNGTLEGGYYPVKYDARYSAAGEKQSDSSTLDQMFNKYASSSTRQGYMKERTSFAAPMSLDWQSIVSRHLDEVITDISHWQFATDTQRLLKRPEIKDAIHDRLGSAYYKNLLDWVRYTVNQDNVAPEASDNIEKFRRQIRSNMSTYVLGFKVANAVNELAIGAPLMMQQVKVSSAFKGIMQYLRNPMEATRFATKASDYMRNIDKEFDRDITQALNSLAGKHSVVDDIRHWSIASRTFFWKIGAVMAWHAGYIDAQEQGLQGKAAIRIADSIYRMTQESGRAGDLSAVQRNPYMKELTQFIGPSLIQYNNNRRAVMAFKDQGFNAQTATLGLTTLLAGHVANAIIFDLLRGKQPDDLDKLPAWILARLTLGLFDGIPVMRDIAGYAESKITGEKGREPRLSPVLQWGKDAVDSVSKTVNAAAGNVDWHKAIIQDAKAVGGATGLPTLAGSTIGQYIYDVLSGDYKPEHPWSPATDLFYNRTKK